MKTLILLVLLLTNCGLPPQHQAPFVQTIDQEFDYYVGRFEAVTGVIVNSSIGFGSMNSERWMGYCQVDGNSRVITISPEHWETSSDIVREILIFHELGHCTLGFYSHENGLSDLTFIGWGTDDPTAGNEAGHAYPEYTLGEHKCPKSIMRWYMFSDEEVNECYLVNLEYYYEDLTNL